MNKQANRKISFIRHVQDCDYINDREIALHMLHEILGIWLKRILNLAVIHFDGETEDHEYISYGNKLTETNR